MRAEFNLQPKMCLQPRGGWPSLSSIGVTLDLFVFVCRDYVASDGYVEFLPAQVSVKLKVRTIMFSNLTMLTCEGIYCNSYYWWWTPRTQGTFPSAAFWTRGDGMLGFLSECLQKLFLFRAVSLGGVLLRPLQLLMTIAYGSCLALNGVYTFFCIALSIKWIHLHLLHLCATIQSLEPEGRASVEFEFRCLVRNSYRLWKYLLHLFYCLLQGVARTHLPSTIWACCCISTWWYHHRTALLYSLKKTLWFVGL